MRFVFFGPPGAGKGTMSMEAAKVFGLPHISSGELFRAAIREGTPLGIQVRDLIGRGSLVPDDLTIELMGQRLAQPDAAHGWLLDGFPRTVPQAHSLSAMVPEDYVIDLEVSDSSLIQRLSGRRMCASCGKSYHLAFKPPKSALVCDDCGGTLYQREDDAEDSIKRRLDTYRLQTEPLEAFYEKRGSLVRVNVEAPADVVWERLRSIMEKLIKDGSKHRL